MERSLEYFVLDVFSDTRLAGNPLAVFLTPQALPAGTMQAIARETNLSETTFVERRATEIEEREGVRVRIFTTEEELPFAGHPTLGTASLLRAIAPECVRDNTVTLALNVGPVPVRFIAQAAEPSGLAPSQSSSQPFGSWPLHGEMIQNNPVFGEVLDPDQVAALTGLTTADFDPALPIQVVSTGTAFAIVPLRSADALSRLNVRQHEATAFLRARGARWFYVLGPRATSSAANAVQQNYAGDEPPGSWQARMQFSGGEDPATGSAAGCAISHLVYYGAVAPDRQLIVHQGIEIKRPSKILLRASLVSGPDSDRDQRHVTNVGVGGSTVLVASGRLFLP